LYDQQVLSSLEKCSQNYISATPDQEIRHWLSLIASSMNRMNLAPEAGFENELTRYKLETEGFSGYRHLYEYLYTSGLTDLY